MQTAEGFYDPKPDLTQYYQGDILSGVPFPTWPTLRSGAEIHKWAILRPLKANLGPVDRLPSHIVARASRDVPDSFDNLLHKEFVLASCELRRILILTRGCELDKDRKQVIVAPVTLIRDLPEIEREPNRLAKIRSQESEHKFYLPQSTQLDESFADFFRITAIHRDLLPDEDVSERLAARLSSAACSRLQICLSKFFGQSFGFDRWNECPQDGIYSCSACFFHGREVRKLMFRAGEAFGPCPVCGDTAEYVKLP